MNRTGHPRLRLAVLAAVVGLIVAAASGGVGAGPEPARGDSAVAAETQTPQPTTETESADPTGATTTKPAVSVQDGTLPVDAGRVFARVQQVLGTDVSPPGYVRVVDEPSGLAPADAAEMAAAPRFWRLVGVASEPALNETERDQLENGFTTGLGGIVLYPGTEPTPTTVTPLLAHEYVHYVQFVQKRGVEVSRAVNTRTTDGQFVRRSVLEGAAVYATDAYVDRYPPASRPNSAWYPQLQRKLLPGSVSWYANTAYIFGHRYVADRLDSPRHLSRIYADPPTTSEQVIHGLQPAAEPPVPLNVTVRSDRTWLSVGTDRLGEAFIRATLANGVSASRATRGAAGWGNDTLRIFRSSSRANSSYVWVLRWDDAANATEFESAFTRYLDARGNESAANGTWRLRGRTVDVYAPSDRVVVVAFGPRTFVDRLQPSATGSRVVVRIGDDRPMAGELVARR
ncbi:hypothetical protein BRC82_09500 [Halobacteriales archaeon QS_1_67_19]|nr:MAG: hypothetical protein BRC82_09500 [Halobacteriales archaeon QS_1_67_19]